MKMSFAGDGRLEMGYGEWMQMEIKMKIKIKSEKGGKSG